MDSIRLLSTGETVCLCRFGSYMNGFGDPRIYQYFKNTKNMVDVRLWVPVQVPT
jgi:hypothetical protein